MFRGHSKLYQRRREIERELRREFEFAEGDKFLAAAAVGFRDAVRSKSPVMFGRPPPVPRPVPRPGVRPNLPPIPKFGDAGDADGLPRKRWGLLDGAGMPRAPMPPPVPSVAPEEPWRQRDRDELLRRQSSGSPDVHSTAATAAPAPPPPPSRVVTPRPSSWREAKGNSPPPPSPGPSHDSHAKSPVKEPCVEGLGMRRARAASESTLPDRDVADPFLRPHVEKAKELEALVRELKYQREEARKKAQEVSERAQADGTPRRRAREDPGPSNPSPEEKVREQQRNAQESDRLRREAEQAEERRQSQDDWEQEFRRKFKDEEAKRAGAHEIERLEEERRRKAADELKRLEQEREERRRQEAERERISREKRRAEAAESRRKMAERTAAAEREAEFEADRLRERLREQEREAAEASRRHHRSQAPAGGARSQSSAPPPTCPPPPPRAPNFFGPPPGGFGPPPGGFAPGGGGNFGAGARPRAGAADPPPFGACPAGAGGAGRRPPGGGGGGGLNFNATLAPKANLAGDKLAAFRQAEASALSKLRNISALPDKESRQKAFKDLLRAWHPDKNPSNSEVATAVFQRIQSEKAKAVGL